MLSAATPITLTETESGAQSLASGTVGHALLAVERAVNGAEDWTAAHRLIQQAAGRVDAAVHTGLYYGAPAIAFLLHTTAADGHDRFPAARQALDRHVRRLTRTRLTIATARLRAGRQATFAEYDLFTGLIGFGALLQQLAPNSNEYGEVLCYLVQLADPGYHDDLHVPGWWVEHDPDPLYPTPGGHANLGMAHGAAGLLALLAHAARQGHHVPGQLEAIGRLCGWFDQWRQESPYGPWWPQWITRDQLRTGHLMHDCPPRPSWCYGTPGIARALQLAAIATRDHTRKTAAEHALAECLTSPQRDRVTDPGICHGLAGLYQTAHRAAADTTTPVIARQLPSLADRITHTDHGDGDGFLTGTTGVLLAKETIHADRTCTRWDTCLLIA
jgi:lantibiotic biosynthesis protein